MCWTAVKLPSKQWWYRAREWLGHNLVAMSPDYHTYKCLHHVVRNHLTWCVIEGFEDGEGRHTHLRKEDCFQYIYVSKVMTFQSPRCNVVLSESSEHNTKRPCEQWHARFHGWAKQFLHIFPLPHPSWFTGHLWIAWGSGDLIHSALPLWSSFHLEIQNRGSG